MTGRMMLFALAALSAIGLTFAAGWSFPGANPAPIAVARPAGGPPSRGTERPANDPLGVIADLAFYIGDDRFVRMAEPAMAETAPDTPYGDSMNSEPSEEADPVALPPPPPPPPDPGLVFRRQLTAVVSEPDGRLAALLTGPGGRRRLHVGDSFDGVWILTALTRDAAVLHDGRRSRRVPFFGGTVTDGDENHG